MGFGLKLISIKLNSFTKGNFNVALKFQLTEKKFQQKTYLEPK